MPLNDFKWMAIRFTLDLGFDLGLSAPFGSAARHSIETELQTTKLSDDALSLSLQPWKLHRQDVHISGCPTNDIYLSASSIFCCENPLEIVNIMFACFVCSNITLLSVSSNVN